MLQKFIASVDNYFVVKVFVRVRNYIANIVYLTHHDSFIFLLFPELFCSWFWTLNLPCFIVFHDLNSWTILSIKVGEGEDLYSSEVAANVAGAKASPFKKKQAVLAQISKTVTNFHNVMTQLPEGKVVDTLTDGITDYDHLKKSFLDHFRRISTSSLSKRFRILRLNINMKVSLLVT